MKHNIFIIPIACAIALACTMWLPFRVAAANVSPESDLYTPFLQEIEKNNPSLRVAQRELEAERAENSTGLTPENPEVEFGYLWGDPATGDRKDITVSQSFDFPTVYRNRRRLASQKDISAGVEYMVKRHDILLKAKECLVELTYCNAMRRLYTEQSANAQAMLKGLSEMLTRGAATKLDYNKASAYAAIADNQLRDISLQRESLLAELQILNGGIPIDFTHSELRGGALPVNFDLWLATAAGQYPLLKYLQNESRVNQREISLAKSEGLPKFSLGYQGEFVRGSNFQGVNLGVSLPLWENRNRVKAAKAKAAMAEESAATASEEYALTLKALYERARNLEEMLLRYRTDINPGESMALLEKAYEKGNITLLEFLTEQQYYLGLREKELSTARDYALALARIYSHTL